MSHFICPVCGAKLNTAEKSLICQNRHSYDLAKSGYVNLLVSQQPKAKRHGDDKRMVHARRDFLNRGYYAPLLEGLRHALEPHVREHCTVLDAGCGECWYTANLYEHLTSRGSTVTMLGVDISKDALALGAKRDPNLELAVASIFRLPVAAASCDIVLSLFAPFASEEILRVLKPGGILIRAFPLEKHLLSLKAVVYDQVYENKVDSAEPDGFTLLDRQEIREWIHLPCREDIEQVFTMTPYYYKTGAHDQQKLTALTRLVTEIEFGIDTYRSRKQ